LQVSDYEATVQHTDWGKWKIVVHVDTAYGSKYIEGARATYSHRIVQFESLDSEADKTKAYPDSYQYLTVGGLFDRVDNFLYCQENSCKQQDFFLPSHYVVEFDQTMGYPRSITSINRTFAQARVKAVM